MFDDDLTLGIGCRSDNGGGRGCMNDTRMVVMLSVLLSKELFLLIKSAPSGVSPLVYVCPCASFVPM